MSVLRGDEDGQFVKWSGIKCSTWVSISRPTTKRSFFCPLGNEALECVAQANIMASRLALVCCLVCALSATWVVEQPSSSLLFRHPRMQWVCDVCKVECSVVSGCACMHVFNMFA